MILKKLYNILKIFKKYQVQIICVGWGSSVGTAICYGLDGPEIESRWGEIFRTRSDRPWDPPSTESPSGLKRPGPGFNHPPHLLSLWAFVACSRLNFTLQVIYNRRNNIYFST